MVRAPRRATEWVASADIDVGTQLNGTAGVLDQSLTGAQVSLLAPFTIVRTVGFVAVKSDQVAATESFIGALGALVVTESARVAGVASIPTPVTEMSDEMWFLFQGFQGGIEFLDATGTQNGYRIFHFDSKAQRKVQDGEAIVFMLENGAASGVGLQFWLQFRMLLKTH